MSEMVSRMPSLWPEYDAAVACGARERSSS